MTHKPSKDRGKINRRVFLNRSAAAAAGAAGAAGLGGCTYWTGRRKRPSRAAGKKVIVIGVDGMDPRLCEKMMAEGLLPNLSKLNQSGGYSSLGTSIPPQSPVAWANFINGSGPGSHGIFDFVHRHPDLQGDPASMYFSAAETTSGEGYWNVGEHQLQLDFWPFGHKPPETKLLRKGVPFWDDLDKEGIPSTFYDLPSNYPPSPSQYGHHRCICGMGTPDLLGGYGTYQYFGHDGPPRPEDRDGGRHSRLRFENGTARAILIGPENSFLKSPKPVEIEFLVHRDPAAAAAVIEIQGQKIVLDSGQMSRWTRLDFSLDTPWFVPDPNVQGICRFFLQEVSPDRCRLYVSPINVDPSAPATPVSEPDSFITDVSKELGLFYTTGFQEDHAARKNGVFDDDEYAKQAELVFEERKALYEYAMDDYEDGLLFFYFSSTDLQSHIFWWDPDEANGSEHPIRSAAEAEKYFGHIRKLYGELDKLVGDLLDRYGSQATILMMSDHGFANFGRQFNLNSWLRDFGYLGPPECTSLFSDVDWSQTFFYGLGINGLYVNLKGRERDGIVEPGDEQEALTQELIRQLEGVRDYYGQQVIRKVYRADEVYQGQETAMAPDLIVGYARNYRGSWATMLGDLTDEWLLDNDLAWSADHCADALEVPGILFSNRTLSAVGPEPGGPMLIDIAPSILGQFGLSKPARMEGRNILSG